MILARSLVVLRPACRMAGDPLVFEVRVDEFADRTNPTCRSVELLPAAEGPRRHPIVVGIAALEYSTEPAVTERQPDGSWLVWGEGCNPREDVTGQGATEEAALIDFVRSCAHLGGLRINL